MRAIRNGASQPLEILVIDKFFNYEAKKICDSFSATYVLCKGSVTQALNKGIESAKGNIVAFTDDDAIPDARWLESIVKSFVQNMKVGVVGGPVLTLHTDVLDVSRIVFFKIPLISMIYNAVVLDGKQGKAIGYLARSGETVHSQQIPLSPICVDYVKGCNFAVRRDLAIRSGGLSTFFIGHSEYWEVDLCTKVKSKGFSILFDPHVRVVHKVEGGSRRPFFDRCYNYVMFFLMNRKKANLSRFPFLINLIVKNTFYIIFSLRERNANIYDCKLGTFMPLVAAVLAFKDYFRSSRPRC